MVANRGGIGREDPVHLDDEADAGPEEMDLVAHDPTVTTCRERLGARTSCSSGRTCVPVPDPCTCMCASRPWRGDVFGQGRFDLEHVVSRPAVTVTVPTTRP